MMTWAACPLLDTIAQTARRRHCHELISLSAAGAAVLFHPRWTVRHPAGVDPAGSIELCLYATGCKPPRRPGPSVCFIARQLFQHSTGGIARAEGGVRAGDRVLRNALCRAGRHAVAGHI